MYIETVKTTDEDRWNLVREHGLTIMLDNDETYYVLDGEEDWVAFDNSIGNSPGIPTLLEYFGIKSEGV